jgi:uncharacterized protein
VAGENDKFELYQDKKGEWRWRRTASNGRLVGASSEGYSSKSDAEANMKRGLVASDKWEIYQDKKSEWRWRRFAQNGRQVGKSTEGYKSKSDAEANAKRQGYSG